MMINCYNYKTNSFSEINEDNLYPLEKFADQDVDFCHDGSIIYDYISGDEPYFTISGKIKDGIPSLWCDGECKGENCDRCVDEINIDYGIWNDCREVYCKECVERIHESTKRECLLVKIRENIEKTTDCDLLEKICFLLEK